IQYESEPGVRIIGWFVQPRNGVARHPCVLYISDGYADEAVVEPSPFDGAFGQGNAVYAISTRGTGLSLPHPPRGGPVFYEQMDLYERFAWASLVLGKPVIGQRVWDILRAFDYLASRPDVDTSKIQVIGQEEAGLAALMAAVLDERAQSILLTRVLVTYMSIVQSTDYSLPLGWFAPGILQHFDVPDLAAALYLRPVWVLDAVSASGDFLSDAEVRQSYSQRIPEDSPAFKAIKILSSPEHDQDVDMNWLNRS
ncbi:MAG: acetylxylan esterase, partial [Limisphaerales bacterium]